MGNHEAPEKCYQYYSWWGCIGCISQNWTKSSYLSKVDIETDLEVKVVKDSIIFYYLIKINWFDLMCFVILFNSNKFWL